MEIGYRLLRPVCVFLMRRPKTGPGRGLRGGGEQRKRGREEREEKEFP